MWFQNQQYRNPSTSSASMAELRQPTVMSTTIPLSQRFGQQVRTSQGPGRREPQPQFASDPRLNAGRYNRRPGIPVSYADLEEVYDDDDFDTMEPHIQMRRPRMSQRGYPVEDEFEEEPAFSLSPAKLRQEAIRNSIAANLERYHSRGRRGGAGNFVRRPAGSSVFNRVTPGSIPRVGVVRGGRGRGQRTSVHMRIGTPNISRQNFNTNRGFVGRGGRGRGMSNRGGTRGQTNAGGSVSKDHLDKELESYMAKKAKSKTALDREMDMYMKNSTKPNIAQVTAPDDNDVSMTE